LQAFDTIGPKFAKSSIQQYNSFSWDTKAGGWFELKDVKTVTETYDKNGRVLTREISYDKGKLLEKTVYTYSEEGFHRSVYDSEKKVTRTAETVIEEHRVTETIYYPDKSVYTKIISYTDDGGLPQKSELYDARGKLVWRVAFKYDEKKNCTAASYYNPDGSLAFESQFEYAKEDKKGNWTERTEYCAYGDVGSRAKDKAYRTIEYAD
jgi:hypothetical protein